MYKSLHENRQLHSYYWNIMRKISVQFSSFFSHCKCEHERNHMHGTDIVHEWDGKSFIECSINQIAFEITHNAYRIFVWKRISMAPKNSNSRKNWFFQFSSIQWNESHSSTNLMKERRIRREQLNVEANYVRHVAFHFNFVRRTFWQAPTLFFPFLWLMPNP